MRIIPPPRIKPRMPFVSFMEKSQMRQKRAITKPKTLGKERLPYCRLSLFGFHGYKSLMSSCQARTVILIDQAFGRSLASVTGMIHDPF
jgi:hypothetical protein